MKLNAQDLLSRAVEAHSEADDILDEAATYRTEVNKYLNQVSAVSPNQVLTDLWLNANYYEREYLRRSRAARRRGDRWMRRFRKAQRREQSLERVLIDPNLGSGLIDKVTLNYASDEDDILKETRARIEEKSPEPFLIPTPVKK